MLTQNIRLPLGFTFSYPVEQQYVDRGTLVTWTKGFEIAGVEGQDVVLQLDEAISKRVSRGNNHAPMQIKCIRERKLIKNKHSIRNCL